MTTAKAAFQLISRRKLMPECTFQLATHLQCKGHRRRIQLTLPAPMWTFQLTLDPEGNGRRAKPSCRRVPVSTPSHPQRRFRSASGLSFQLAGTTSAPAPGPLVSRDPGNVRWTFQLTNSTESWKSWGGAQSGRL